VRPPHCSYGVECGAIGRVLIALESGLSAVASSFYFSVSGAEAFSTVISCTCRKFAKEGSNRLSRWRKVFYTGVALWLLGILIAFVGSKKTDRFLLLPLDILSISLVVGFLGHSIVKLHPQGMATSRDSSSPSKR
jgi:hypothetical protein